MHLGATPPDLGSLPRRPLLTAQYTAALELVPCTSTDLALTLYNNRAACRQQMREPEAALADASAVLAVEPANAKALARKAVCEQAIKAAA